MRNMVQNGRMYGGRNPGQAGPWGRNGGWNRQTWQNGYYQPSARQEAPVLPDPEPPTPGLDSEPCTCPPTCCIPGPVPPSSQPVTLPDSIPVPTGEAVIEVETEQVVCQQQTETIETVETAETAEMVETVETMEAVESLPEAAEEIVQPPEEEITIQLDIQQEQPEPDGDLCPANQPYEPAAQRIPAPACQGIRQYITDNQGAPAQDDDHSLTAGANGPMLMKDAYYFEKMAHFDREKIPERVVHANGAGAFGSFRVTNPMGDYTTAEVFCQQQTETPVFVRFSTVAGHKGSADTVRDPRGFAVKFYTNQGNLDIVGINFPVFFLKDAIKFPDLLHALKPAPDTGVKDQVRWWDYFSQTPEATNMVTYYYSDQGTMKSYRKMDGFGVDTFVWVNSQGQRFYVRYHFRSRQGVETIDRQEAAYLAGVAPDIAKMDLFQTLAQGQTAMWDFAVQLMPVCDGEALAFDPLDTTKLWPEDQFPLQKVGELVLDRNPENVFCQVEQAAFCPANLVPGIEFSDDKLLNGRIFSYGDAQRYRIGANFAQLPVNKPLCEPENYQQDGAMRLSYRKGTVNYYPSSCTLGCGPQQKPQTPPYTAQYSMGRQMRSEIQKIDDFTQAGQHFRQMSPLEQQHLADNIAADLYPAPDYVVEKCIEYFTKACPEWGQMTAQLVENYRLARAGQ